jgi:hypothetical protein
VNFEDEPYIRVYKRRTLTIKLLGWEGRTVFWALLLEVDRAGVLDLGDESPAQALAALSDLPLEVAEVGMARALKLGVVEHRGGALFVPRFMEAQEAKQSDKARQRDSRGRRAALMRCSEGAIRAAAEGGSSPLDVTNRDHKQSQNVTETPVSVTRGHTESHAVTPCHSEISSDQLSSAELRVPSELKQRVGKPRAAAKPREVPVPMSDAIQLSEELILAKATAWQVSPEVIRAKIPAFRLYWKDRGDRRTPAGWARTFSNRMDTEGKNGFLHRPEPASVVRLRSAGDIANENIKRQLERVKMLEEKERKAAAGEGV